MADFLKIKNELLESLHQEDAKIQEQLDELFSKRESLRDKIDSIKSEIVRYKTDPLTGALTKEELVKYLLEHEDLREKSKKLDEYLEGTGIHRSGTYDTTTNQNVLEIQLNQDETDENIERLSHIIGYLFDFIKPTVNGFREVIVLEKSLGVSGIYRLCRSPDSVYYIRKTVRGSDMLVQEMGKNLIDALSLIRKRFYYE